MSGLPVLVSTLRCLAAAPAAAGAANLLLILAYISSPTVSQDGPRGKKWRCLFICNVAVGRAYCTTETGLLPEKCPPQGYDSVVGEVSLHALRGCVFGLGALRFWHGCTTR